MWTEEWEGIPVIVAEGEVDLGTVDELRAAASEVVRSHPPSMIFDFRKVTYIDSSGLGILVAARKQLRGDPSAVVVITDQTAVLQSLRITGLERMLRVLRDPSTLRPTIAT